MAFGGLNIGDLLLTLLADGSMLKRDIERQGTAAANAAGPAIGQSLGASMAGGLARSGKAMETIGMGLTKNLTVPIVAAGFAITDVGVKFDTQLRQIVALTDVTSSQIGGIKDAILALAPAVGKSPQELADAFYYLASGGFNAKEALDVLDVSARAAASGLGSTVDVATVVGSSINAFGHDILKPKDAVDQLIRAIKDGTAEAPQFASALGDVVGSAALLKVSFSDTAGALAAMTLKGVNADEGATSLNQIFRSLIKVTPQAAKAFASVGTSAADLKKVLAEQGLIKFLQIVNDKFKGNDEAAAKAFGNVRALRGILALISTDNGARTAQILDDVAHGATNLGTAFDETNGPGRRMNQALARMQVVLIKLSDDVLPVVVRIMDKTATVMETIAGAFKALPAPVRSFIVDALALAAALGPVLFVTGKITKSLGGLLGAIKLIGRSKIGKAIAENLFGPLLNGSKALATKIATPIAGAIESVTTNSKVTGAASGVGKFLGSTIGKAFSFALAGIAIAGVIDTVNQIQAMIDQQQADIASGIAKTVADGSTQALLQSKDALEKGIKDLRDNTALSIFSLPSQLLGSKSTQQDQIDQLTAQLDIVNKALADKAAQIGPTAASSFDHGWSQMTDTVSKAVHDTTLSAAAEAAGKSIPNAIADGILANQKAPVDALSSLKALMKDQLTWKERIGQDIGILLSKTLAAGLRDGRGLVSKEAQRTRDLAERDLARIILQGGKIGKDAAAALAKALHDKNPAVRAAAQRIQAIVDSALAGTVKPAGDAGTRAGEAFKNALRAAIGKSMQIGINIHAHDTGKNGKGKAIGGPVRAGVPYPVNESTPYSEIFVPSVSGRIVTRDQAAAAIANASGASGGMHYHIPISVTGVLDARKPDDVARPLRQLAASGALTTRRDRERVKVPQRV